jgi:hypothetical protein
VAAFGRSALKAVEPRELVDRHAEDSQRFLNCGARLIVELPRCGVEIDEQRAEATTGVTDACDRKAQVAFEDRTGLFRRSHCGQVSA